MSSQRVESGSITPRHSFPRLLIRCALYWLLAIAVTWPLILHLPDKLLGHPDVDLWNHIWGFWWVKTTLLEQHLLPLFTHLLSYPAGGKLYFIDPLNALLSIPLQAWLGLVPAYNLTLLGELALAGFGAHLLAREAGAGERGAYLAGLSVVTSPMLRCEMHNGITEVGNVGWLALSLWATHRALRTARARDAALAGALVALAFVACWYFGLAAGAATVLLWALTTPWRPIRPGRLLSHWRALLAWGLCCALIALPFWAAFSWTLKPPLQLIARNPGQSHFLIRHNATDLLSFFMPGDYHRPDLWHDYQERFLHTTYLGWVALVLAFLAVRARAGRIWLAVGAVFAVLALGPYLFAGGQFVTVGRKLIPLPFAGIFYGLGLVSITHPARLALVTLLCLGVLLALGHDWLEQRFPRIARAWAPTLAAMIACEALLLAPAPFPVSLADATLGSCTQALAADPVPGPVLDLPGKYLNTMRSSRYLYAQTAHRRPVPYAVNVRPESAPGFRYEQLYRWILTIAGENDPARIDALKQVPLEQLKRDFTEQFLYNNYRYVVLHRDIVTEPFGLWPYRYIFDAVIGPPKSTPDGCWIYQIGGTN